MITLYILNLIVNVGNQILLIVLGNTVLPALNGISTWVDTISIPQTLYNIYSLVNYFLPMGTVSVLMGMTLTVIVFKMAISVVHFISLGLLWK